MLWPQFVDWLSSRDKPIRPELNEKAQVLVDMIANREDVETIVETYHTVEDILLESNLPELLLEFQSTRSPAVKYWQQYIGFPVVAVYTLRKRRELATASALVRWNAPMVSNL